ncbi:MAG: hypothetical protein HZB75_03685 [Candidatus Saccharibacteria bacterium]|nr:MAG: hypothetical protein HZB75_03685 [Candidatus Saccharibacteria bacterium]
MLVLKSTHARAVRELNNDLSAAYADNSRLETANRRLRTQNALILPMVMNAATNLVPVFGPLESLGSDEHDSALLFVAADGLANVALYPATSEIVVSDPNNVVDGVRVSLDGNGALDRHELREIRTFRAEVLFIQQQGNTRAIGPVSLTAKSRPASPDAEQEPAV